MLNNWPAKILAILLSASLWLAVIAGQAKTAAFPGKIPLTFINAPKEHFVTSEIKSVSIKLVAETDVWDKLTANSFKAEVDLKDLSVGTHHLKPKVTANIEGVKIVEINPALITVLIEPSVSKTIPLTLKVIGEPKTGLAIASTEMTPSQVEVTGPQSLVSQLTEAVSEVTLNKEDSLNQTLRAKVKVFDSLGEATEYLSFSPKEVTVKIRLDKAATVKSVGVKLKTIAALPPNLTLESIALMPNIVSVNGEINQLQNLTSLETEPVDLSQITTSSTIETKLVLPEGISLVDIENLVRVNFIVRAVN